MKYKNALYISSKTNHNAILLSIIKKTIVRTFDDDENDFKFT